MPMKIVPQATQAAAGSDAQAAAPATPQTPAQLEIVLSQIAAAAASIQRLAALMTDDGEQDHRDVEAHRQAIETLAQRIGLLADWSAASPERGRGVEDWFLPPAWHATRDAREGADHA